MSAASDRELVFVVDEHVARVVVSEVNRPESLSVEVVVDDRRVRGWEEPGWRDVAFGATAGSFYWWSARRVVRVVLAPSVAVAEEITYDEDVLLVFVTDCGILLVGETSVSLVQDGAVASRVEIDDVIISGHVVGGRLVVETMDGRSLVALIEPSGLRLQS